MPIKTPQGPPPGPIEMSEDEYLVREPESDYRSEFRQGRVEAMSGGTEAHSLIIGNTHGELRQQLKGHPCKVHMADMRTKVAAAGLYTYPDVAVVCGPSVFDTKDKNALTNPTVIVEVLSKNTEKYDRIEKFGYYKKIDSLITYVLISQRNVRVERYTREGIEWPVQILTSLDDTLELPAIGCRVFVREIYDKVDFSLSDAGD